jgi:hypothetical protein
LSLVQVFAFSIQAACCALRKSDIFISTDDISDDDKDFVIDALYRKDLLNIFNVEDFNEDIFDKVISDLYAKLYIHKELSLLMEILASRYMSIDKEFGLMLLFSFDYLYLSHPCICEFIEFGKITQETFDKLKEAIIL